jgi:hypothetical protein
MARVSVHKGVGVLVVAVVSATRRHKEDVPNNKTSTASSFSFHDPVTPVSKVQSPLLATPHPLLIGETHSLTEL